MASLPVGSEDRLVADTADLVVGRRASSSRMHACCWAFFEEPDRLEGTRVRTLEPDRMDSRVCRTRCEVEGSEVHCRDEQVGKFRSVGVSQPLDSYGAGLLRHLPPMDTLGLLVSLIWSWTLCLEERCRTRHASDG